MYLLSHKCIELVPILLVQHNLLCRRPMKNGRINTKNGCTYTVTMDE